MGSFTELSLSFHFKPDTPPEVLATFAPLRAADQTHIRSPAPELPTFEPVPGDDWWEPDWKEYAPDYEGEDPLAAEPWRHEWAPWLSQSMSVFTVPTAALVWSEVDQWHFSCRCSFKSAPYTIFDSLRWLGPFIETSDNPYYPRPDLVGLMTWDNAFRPYLLFCQYGNLTMENLNGPDEEF